MSTTGTDNPPSAARAKEELYRNVRIPGETRWIRLLELDCSQIDEETSKSKIGCLQNLRSFMRTEKWFSSNPRRRQTPSNLEPQPDLERGVAVEEGHRESTHESPGSEAAINRHGKRAPADVNTEPAAISESSSSTLQPAGSQVPTPPSSDSPALRGTLRAVPLDSFPPFNALSYVWGGYTEPQKDVIECNGVAVEITTNCRDALLALRKRNAPKTFTIWIDAICINQDDDDEKGTQIQFMNAIYSTAEIVFVWLGLGNEASGRAMQWLRTASVQRIKGSTALSFSTAKTKSKRLSEFFKLIWEMKVVFSTFSTWRAIDSRLQLRKSYTTSHLDEVFSRDWIHRVWTFQELVLADNLFIVCGNEGMPWDQLVCSLDHIKNRKIEKQEAEGPEPRCEIKLIASPVDENAFSVDRFGASGDWPYEMTPHFNAWYNAYYIWLNVGRGSVSDSSISAAGAPKKTIKEAIQPFVYAFHQLLKYGLIIRYTTILPSFGIYMILLGKLMIELVEDGLFGVRIAVTLCVAVLGILVLAFVFPPYEPLRGSDHISFYVELPFTCWSLSVRLPGVPLEEERRQINFPAVPREGVDEADRGVEDSLFMGVKHAIVSRKATRPKDRAFAVRGVLEALGIQLSEVKYPAPRSQIYGQLFLDLIQWRLDYLSCIVDPGTAGVGSRPTWAPDWNAGPSANRVRLLNQTFRAAPKEGQAVSLPPTASDELWLVLKGQLVGVIDENSAPFDNLQLTPEQSNLASARTEYDVSHLHVSWSTFLIWLRRLLKRHPIESPADAKRIIAMIDGSDNDNDNSLVASLNESNELFSGGELDDISQLQLMLHSLRFLRRLAKQKRGIVVTKDNMFGTAPGETLSGDVVALIPGLHVPLILRRDPQSLVEAYLVVGPAYVLGMMHGEMFEESKLQDLTLV